CEIPERRRTARGKPPPSRRWRGDRLSGSALSVSRCHHPQSIRARSANRRPSSLLKCSSALNTGQASTSPDKNLGGHLRWNSYIPLQCPTCRRLLLDRATVMLTPILPFYS